MRLRKLGLAALTGVMLSAPMVAVMYLADRWLDLSFPPFDTFDLVARELPGPLVTFGIDTMIEVLMFVGLSVKDFAKTAETDHGDRWILRGRSGRDRGDLCHRPVARAGAEAGAGSAVRGDRRCTGGADDRQHHPVVGEPDARLRVVGRAVPRMGVRAPCGWRAGWCSRPPPSTNRRTGTARWWCTGGGSSSSEWARRPPR